MRTDLNMRNKNSTAEDICEPFWKKTWMMEVHLMVDFWI